MTRRLLLLPAIATLAAAPSPFASAQLLPAAQTTFSVRADPSVAARVDRVLAAVAEPVTVTLRDDQTAADYLRGLCGARAPALLPPGPEDAEARKIRFTPCVRQRTNVQVKVRPGDTREALAVRLGLRATAAGTLQIASADGAPRPRGAALMLGDTAVAPVVPAWTSFTARPGTLATADDLVAALSAALDCAPASEEGCLRPRGVLIMASTSRAATTADDTAPADADVEPRGGTAAAAAGPLPALTSEPLLTAAAPPADPPPPAAEPAAPNLAPVVPSPPPVAPDYPDRLTAADLEASEVAPEQWPYDPGLVNAVLAAAAQRGPVARAVIGIADNGLASAAGGPLPPATFVDTLEPGPPNTFDDDDNGVVDDVIGAGVLRDPYDPMPSGDVALCPNVAAALPGWEGATRREMSHGTVVASIASGLPFRRGAPSADAILPKLVFFRLFRDACGEAGTDYGDGAIEAIDYIVGKTEAKVINLSSFVDAQGGIRLKSRIESLANYGTPLLVVPAGNAAINLDDNNPCPPCLANLSNGAISRGIVAIGTATRALRPAVDSGRGYGTVRLFAPGEPAGAIDIAGQAADDFPPSTSYAAPLVSLAAALIGAQGDGDAARLRNRLLLSTWPLYDENGLVGRAGGPIDVGVLDLVKAVAIRYDVVEVVERRDGGRLVRRTYVGDITAGLDGVGAGTAIGGTSLLGLRLGAVGSDGARLATLILRTIDIEKRVPKYQALSARPAGGLSLHLIDGADVVLPWAAVTQILFRGRKP